MRGYLGVLFSCLILISEISAQTYPSFDDEILVIPRIDTSEKAGFYQDVTFKLNSSGTWNLQNYRIINNNPLWQPAIEEVELIVVDSFPVQVYLKVKSDDIGCTELGQINQRINNDIFEVEIYTESPDLPLGSYTCTAQAKNFEKIIPLSVYDLEAGDYGYTVNGKHKGTFKLTRDNKL